MSSDTTDGDSCGSADKSAIRLLSLHFPLVFLYNDNKDLFSPKTLCDAVCRIPNVSERGLGAGLEEA